MWIRDKEGNLWNGDLLQHIYAAEDAARNKGVIRCWLGGEDSHFDLAYYDTREQVASAMKYLTECMRNDRWPDLLTWKPPAQPEKAKEPDGR